MSCVLVLLMAIEVVVVLPWMVPLPLLLYPRDARLEERQPSRLQHDFNQDPIFTCLIIYIFIDIIIYALMTMPWSSEIFWTMGRDRTEGAS
jgi:hypothetical protein